MKSDKLGFGQSRTFLNLVFGRKALLFIFNSLSSCSESGRDPFSDSIVITEQTVPSKFDKPLPESQRSPSPKEVIKLPKHQANFNSILIIVESDCFVKWSQVG